MVEGVGTGDGRIEGDRNADHRRDHRIKFGEHPHVIAGHQRLVEGGEAGNHAAEGSDAVALTDAEDGHINVCRPAFQGAEGIGDSAPRIIMAVKLDVATHSGSHLSDSGVDLTRRSDADGIG